MSTNLTRDQSDAQRTYEEFLGRANDARNSLNDAQWAQVAAAQTAFKQVWAAGPDDARLDAADVFKKTIRAVLKGETAPAGDQSVPPVPAPIAPAPSNSTPQQPPAPAPSPAPASNDKEPAWLNAFVDKLDETQFKPIHSTLKEHRGKLDNHEERIIALETDNKGFKKMIDHLTGLNKGAAIGLGLLLGVITAVLVYVFWVQVPQQVLGFSLVGFFVGVTLGALTPKKTPAANTTTVTDDRR